MTHAAPRLLMNESEGNDETIRSDSGLVINITINVVHRHHNNCANTSQQIGSRLLMEESDDGDSEPSQSDEERLLFEESSDSVQELRDESGAPVICSEDQEQIGQGDVHDEQLNSNSGIITDDQEIVHAPTPCTNGHDACPIVIHNSYVDDYVDDE